MSWIEKSLDELGSVNRGRSRHRPRDAEHLYGGPYPFIQTGDVKHAGLNLTKHEQTYSEAGLAQSKLWKAGTLCITIAANIAETSILGIDACFPDSVIGFVADDKSADTRFVKYMFDARLKRRYRTFSQGVAQDNLSQEKLLSIKFKVPEDVNQQRKIADILAAYDEMISNNLRRVELLEISARHLFKEWFVRLRYPGHAHSKIVDALPKGWKKERVENLTMFISRGITPKYDDEAESIVINQKCVRDRLLDLGPARRQSKEVPANKMVRRGDVLVNSTGEGTLGRVAQVLEDIANCTVDSHVTIIRPKAQIKPLFFGLFMTALEEFLAKQGRGATNQTELSKGAIEDLKMLVPPEPLMEEFETIVEPIFLQIVGLSKQNKKLEEARDLLLPRLMNGQIVV